MLLDLTENTLSLSNALACAQLSAQCYIVAAPAGGAANSFSIETPLAHIRITELDNAFVIAFRGSVSISDWITDAKFPQRQVARSGVSSAIKIHDGFLDSFQTFIGPLAKYFDRFDAKHVFVTGHSLGGAQAALCAAFMAEMNQPVHSVYTFGQPRVGNGAFAQWYNHYLYSRTFRFVYEEDLVPRIPWCLGRYHHAGCQVFLPSTGGYEINPSLPSLIRSDIIGLWRAYRARNAAVIEDCLIDHHIQGYVKRISELVVQSLNPVIP